MILGVQLIGILFALFMLYLTFLHRKRKEFTLKESVFWSLAWLCFFGITLFPTFLDRITKALDFSRTMDLFIVLGFIFILGVTFYNYTLLRRTQNKVEEIVRAVALDHVNIHVKMEKKKTQKKYV